MPPRNHRCTDPISQIGCAIFGSSPEIGSNSKTEKVGNSGSLW
jgi:hypothetical protein